MEHLEAVERASHGYMPTVGDEQLMVTYLLEIGLAAISHQPAPRSLGGRL